MGIKEKLMAGAIEAEEQFSVDELEDFAEGFRACQVCGGEGHSLGVLGTLHWFTCRQCGMQFSKKVG